jgi:hypothetical protein
VNEVVELELPTQENFHTDLRALFQGAVRVALEVVLEVAALDERVRSPKSVLSMRPGVCRVGRLNPRWHVVENDA